MEFLKKHYEKLVLGLLLAVLIGWCLFLWAKLSGTDKTLKESRDAMERNVMVSKPLKALSPELFDRTRIINDPKSEWKPANGASGTLFDPARYISCNNADCRYLLPFATQTCPYCGTAQGSDATVGPAPGQDSDADGIPDLDEKTMGLDPSNPLDAWQEYAKSGFTNLEVFRYRKASGQPAGMPSLASKLRFEKVMQNPVPIVFTKLSRDGADQKQWIFAFTVTDGRGRKTRFVRLGEKFGDYRLLSVNPKTEKVHDKQTNLDEERDVSEVSVQREGEEPFVLHVGEQAFEKSVRVSLVFIRNPNAPAAQCERFSVRVGDVVTLKLRAEGGRPELQETYAVKAIDPQVVVVQQVLAGGAAGPEFKVDRLDEKADFRPAAEAASTMPPPFAR